MPMKVITFTPRFVPDYLITELSNLWHTSRCAAGSDRYQRLLYTSKHFALAHPELSSTAVYKDLNDMLRFGGR